MCGVPKLKQYRLILDSEDEKLRREFQRPAEKVYRSKKGECDGQPYRLAYELPPVRSGGLYVFKNEEFRSRNSRAGRDRLSEKIQTEPTAENAAALSDFFAENVVAVYSSELL